MHRCLELAKMGIGNVAPNPMVGAVLVYDGQIIGEGWHQQYGGAHAEVNCINSVSNENKKYIKASTLYVSLEPCAHVGKTPPCADLIIKHQIPKIVIGCNDPFEEVDGKGIEKLLAAGINVETGVMEEECKELNKRFFEFNKQKRPFIILKWAKTADGMMAGASEGTRLFITNEYSNRLVHQWRSQEAAILIGANTAMLDNPELTTRLWPGKSPIRLVLDLELRLPETLQVFNGKSRTIVFNYYKQEEKNNLLFYKIEKRNDVVVQLMAALYQLQIQSVIVEGGAKLLQTFIEAGLWDEARIFTNEELEIQQGLPSPVLTMASKVSEQLIMKDRLEIFKRNIPDFYNGN